MRVRVKERQLLPHKVNGVGVHTSLPTDGGPTDRDIQAACFARYATSSFDVRAIADFGWLVGELVFVDPHRVAFVPDPRVVEPNPDPLDP